MNIIKGKVDILYLRSHDLDELRESEKKVQDDGWKMYGDLIVSFEDDKPLYIQKFVQELPSEMGAKKPVTRPDPPPPQVFKRY